MSGLAPGAYDIRVWTHSVSTGVWNLWTRSVNAISAPKHVLEAPTLNQAVAQPFTVSGYAIDTAGPTGTGVDAMHVWACHNVGSGSAAYMIGASIYGDAQEGACFKYTPSPGKPGPAPFDRQLWGSQRLFRAGVILSELGHVLSQFTGLNPDAGDTQLGQERQEQHRELLSHCF
jgi:hypothetical protein